MIIVAVVLPSIAEEKVDSALISGNIEGADHIQKESMYYDPSFYMLDKQKIPVLDADGNLLYNLFLGKGTLSDSFELFINGSETGITSLKIAEYVPQDSRTLAYATLIFALKLYCPAGVSVVQFIRIIDYGTNIDYAPVGTEYTDSFPEMKNYLTPYSNSTGDIVEDVIAWVSSQIHKIVDKGFEAWIVNNNIWIGFTSGFIVFTPLFPFKNG